MALSRLSRAGLAAVVVSLSAPLAGASLGSDGTPAEGRRHAGAGEAPELGTENRPLTIPALREWASRPGEFVLGESGRIVIESGKGSGKLADTAELLAEDIASLTGAEYTVVSNAGGRRPGDIHLVLGPADPELGEEGYRLEVGEAIQIAAPAPAGVFYGTRTILQLLRQHRAIPAGVARDWPRYPERGLMVDVGRKFFTPEWLEAHVRELAYLKINYLHLHLSDNEGFRIESETHPEIVSEPHLTKDQVRELIELAERHHITVVPEIDMPGHMRAALAPHPELQLRDAAGRRSPDRLDVTKPAARRFARDLIGEYLQLFPGPYWHTGADEYMPTAEYPLHPQLESYARERYGPAANGKDAFRGFVNWVDEIVRAHGRTTRMWHDHLRGGSAVTVNPDIVVEWWTDFAPTSDLQPPEPQELLDQGHRVMNAGWFPTYYVIGPFGAVRPDMRTAYESWQLYEFYGPFVWDETLQVPPATVAPDEPRNLGSKLHVWNDDPEGETEDEIAAGIFPRLRMLAQKTWGSPRLTETWAEFQPIMESVGRAPGAESKAARDAERAPR